MLKSANLDKKYNISAINDNDFIKKSLIESLEIANIYAKKPNIAIISDHNIWQNCGHNFTSYLKQFSLSLILLQNPVCNDKFASELIQQIEGYNFIIGVGSGTINDLCKFVCHKKGINFVTFASAASMNGYLSKNCSITIDGVKKSVAAILPQKVFCDLNIIKNAPQKLIKAGIGDIMCFNSCYFDWYLAHKLLDYDFNQEVVNIIADNMQPFLKNYKNYDFDNLELYQEVIKILLVSGQAMTIAGSSNPASQSEHLIAHILDMKYPEITKDILHGQLIAITTVISLQIQQDLLNNFTQLLKELPNQDYDNQINQFCKLFDSKTSKSCLEEFAVKQQKIKNIKNHSNQEISEIKLKLNQILMPQQQLQQIFQHFNIIFNPNSVTIDIISFKNCIKSAKFIRNRFTCLDFH